MTTFRSTPLPTLQLDFMLIMPLTVSSAHVGTLKSISFLALTGRLALTPLPHAAITLYVLKDGESSTFKGTCSSAEAVDGFFHLDNTEGSFVNLYNGPLNGYWKSNVDEKLQAGKIETIVPGDDAVIYCPV